MGSSRESDDDKGGRDGDKRKGKDRMKSSRKPHSRNEDESRRDTKHKRRGEASDPDGSGDDRRNLKRSKGKSRHDDSDASSYEDRRKHKKKQSSRRKQNRRSRQSSDESDDTAEDDQTKSIANKKLLEKLAARGETLEEREDRRAKRRAARITAKFGYTADDNPFNDPNIHESFTWKKKVEKGEVSRFAKQDDIFDEIEKVRKRRQDRELQFEEMERIRAEESRMKELENYDEWARKEEEFHLQQQRQRSAIRLVEGREKPIDVLAKNLLLFGLTEEEKASRAAVKYQEKYNAMNELDNIEAELDEPHVFLRVLKLQELEELLVDIDAFRTLEREASVLTDRNDGTGRADDDGAVLRYWDALQLVARDEIQYLKTGGADGSHATMVDDIRKLFEGQSVSTLTDMQAEIEAKLRHASSGATFQDHGGGVIDVGYWKTVLEQLAVHLAKIELSELHSKMLVRQLERLEKKKEALQAAGATQADKAENETFDNEASEAVALVPTNVAPDFGNLEEELGLSSEVALQHGAYSWQDKYRPRKPRYFNRVKTGYDWNKYNQTHYDHDNPPPKTVQGYKFNVFYPDLIDKHKTPQYFIEPADSNEFCILRFHAGPPYEDIAFKIINREWNRSRKRGFRSTFERGVLSLYFNFASHWYRR